MILNRILRAYTFRFIVLYVLVISLCASAISTFVYLYIARNYFDQVNVHIQLELDSAVASFNRNGIEGFNHHIAQRSAIESGTYYYFAIADMDGRTVLAGNVERLPDITYDSQRGFELGKHLFTWESAQGQKYIGHSVSLDNGLTVFVARHFEDVYQRVDLVARTLIFSTIVTIFLGIIGGAFITVSTIRLIDSLNRSIARIMQGDLSERLPISSRGGEIDQLAVQLNIMLDKIEDAMNEVRQVSDNIAHDLRTPLTRLRNRLSTLEKRASDEHRELIKEMVVESDHLLSICGALLRIARVESGTKRTDFTELDLAQIFIDVTELYEPLASVKGIDISIDCSAQAVIQGDRDLLFQMLVNLIDNAIKYTPEGGKIATRLYVEKGIVNLIFADNGLGIPEEKYSKVFQRFYRVEESRGIHPGNGLGLSLVQAVAALHGGQVLLSDSKDIFVGNPTPGMKFTIQIPLKLA